MTETKEATGYPEWICSSCGRTHGRHPPLMSTWHQGECEICGCASEVTQPRDFGQLKPGWHLRALEQFAVEVVRAAMIGDQHFAACLRGDDPATARVRSAIVSLAEVLRTAF